MNKLVKLPLFLGICGAACAGILAGVNALTAPIIEQAKIDAANAAYIETYKEFGVTSDHIKIEEVEIYAANCTTRAVIVNDKVKGVAYTCSAKGYGGTISFQVAFANGKYLGYTDLGNSETPSYGGVVIGKMTSLINGIDANESLLNNSGYASAIAGQSITGKAIANAVDACRTDYLAWYSAQ